MGTPDLDTPRKDRIAASVTQSRVFLRGPLNLVRRNPHHSPLARSGITSATVVAEPLVPKWKRHPIALDASMAVILQGREPPAGTLLGAAVVGRQ